ncbi:hypothetical protein O181_042189 [Austropuccinia psidii MF-1]|uniref:Chromo domain-containing protein n=1 Tax=Austropuccinia psidii MF-1 TaxID=1389203 RepID=A0A9Q3DFL4_9BASI|nr:hypothetical protein [Austropuccinia psidii MF-1]
MAFFQEHQINYTQKVLSERWLGPFPILKKVSTHAYHLKLPSQWKSIHPAFHISLLEPVKTSTIANRNQEPPPIIIEEEEEWEVSQILYSKLKRGQLWYLVEWKGFSQDPERSTWEATKNLKICVLNLSKIFIHYILTRLGPILQKLDSLWCLVGGELPKVSPTPGMHL